MVAYHALQPPPASVASAAPPVSHLRTKCPSIRQSLQNPCWLRASVGDSCRRRWAVVGAAAATEAAATRARWGPWAVVSMGSVGAGRGEAGRQLQARGQRRDGVNVLVLDKVEERRPCLQARMETKHAKVDLGRCRSHRTDFSSTCPVVQAPSCRHPSRLSCILVLSVAYLLGCAT